MRYILATGAVLAGLCSAPALAQQKIDSLGVTVTTNVTLLSDYVFRGVSQTDTQPAIQGGVDIEHDTGLYAGVFASNVNFADANMELDGMFGYRFSLGGLKLDIGGIYYGYPSATSTISFFEAALRGSYEVGPATLLAGFYYSPNFQFNSGDAYYLEGGADVKLPWEITLSGRFGYQWIQRNDRFGLDDFANWSVSASREFFGFKVSVGYYDTDVSKGDCPLGVGGSNVCEARAIASIGKAF